MLKKASALLYILDLEGRMRSMLYYDFLRCGTRTKCAYYFI